MCDDELQALVLEMLHLRPRTSSDLIAEYISVKTGTHVSIAAVNVVLVRLQALGYVVLGHTSSKHNRTPLRVVARRLPTQ